MIKIFEILLYNFFITTILLIFAFTGCSTVSKEVNFDINKMKNQASDETKTANDFISRYDYTKALEYLKKALNSNIMVDNTSGIISNYSDIGRVYMLLKDFDKSLESFKKALEIAVEFKEFREEKAYTLTGLGELYYIKEDYEKARNCYKDALTIEIQLNNVENQAILLQNMAKIDRASGNYKKALEQLISSAKNLEKLYRSDSIENVKNLSLIYYTIGQTYSKLGNFKSSIDYITKALTIDKQIENSSGIADDYFALALLSEKNGTSADQLIKYYLRAKSIYGLLLNLTKYLETSEKLSSLYLTKGDLKNYYENKKIIYQSKKNQADKNIISQEILQNLDNEKVKNYFTESEIAEIKNFLKTF